MKDYKSKQDQILYSIGFTRDPVSGTPSFRDLDMDSFKWYVPSDYENSERKDKDEVYRMSEVVLLHPDTGIRIEYITSESYDGERTSYFFRDIFIITNEREIFSIYGVDFKKKVFITKTRKIPFSDVDKEYNDWN